MLGAAKLAGTGAPKSIDEALRWYTHAAELERAKAQFALGYLYSGAEGVKQNLDLAAYWFLRAAEQGNAMAQATLASFLNKGAGFEVSKVKACAIARVALRKNLPQDTAAHLTSQLARDEATLTAEQLQEIEVLAHLYSTPEGVATLRADLLNAPAH